MTEHHRPSAEEILRSETIADGKIIKEVLQEGEGQEPFEGAEVVVHYTGWLSETGKQFDSSRDRDEHFTFQIGTGSVIKGWDEGVFSMKVGERAVFTIHSEYGYGEAGAGADIPPNSELCFDVELFDVREKKKSKHEMNPAEKLEAGMGFKEQGNAQLKSGEYESAAKNYRECLEFFSSMEDWDEEDLEKVHAISLSAYLNLSNCCVNLKLWSECSQTCSEALANPRATKDNRVKAFYRRAVARMNSGELQEAKLDLKEALELDPRNSAVRAQFEEWKKKNQAEKEKARSAFGGMFEKVGGLYTEKKGVEPPVEHDLKALPKVFMDVKVGEEEPKRMTFALYEDTVPKTVDNFRALCTGEKGEGKCGKPLHYKGSQFHRVIKGFMMQGGDFERANGTGGESIYGDKFDDENFEDSHTQRGLLSMANSGPNTNGSQFFVLFDKASHLDGKHIVFGELVDGFDVLDAVEAVKTGESDKPENDVVIVDSGLVSSTAESSVGA